VLAPVPLLPGAPPEDAELLDPADPLAPDAGLLELLASVAPDEPADPDEPGAVDGEPVEGADPAAPPAALLEGRLMPLPAPESVDGSEIGALEPPPAVLLVGNVVPPPIVPEEPVLPAEPEEPLEELEEPADPAEPEELCEPEDPEEEDCEELDELDELDELEELLLDCCCLSSGQPASASVRRASPAAVLRRPMRQVVTTLSPRRGPPRPPVFPWRARRPRGSGQRDPRQRVDVRFNGTRCRRPTDRRP